MDGVDEYVKIALESRGERAELSRRLTEFYREMITRHGQADRMEELERAHRWILSSTFRGSPAGMRKGAENEAGGEIFRCGGVMLRRGADSLSGLRRRRSAVCQDNGAGGQGAHGRGARGRPRLRTKEEYDEKHIPCALLIPYDMIEKGAPSCCPTKTRKY